MRALLFVVGLSMLSSGCGGIEEDVGGAGPTGDRIVLKDPCTGEAIGEKNISSMEYRFYEGNVVADAEIDRRVVDELPALCERPALANGVGQLQQAVTQSNGKCWIITECGRYGCASCSGCCLGDYCFEDCDDISHN